MFEAKYQDEAGTSTFKIIGNAVSNMQPIMWIHDQAHWIWHKKLETWLHTD